MADAPPKREEDGCAHVAHSAVMQAGFGDEVLYGHALCVADTRGRTHVRGPTCGAGEERITITNNVWNPCHSIPVTAKAVALNVTVTNATSAGNLRIFPAGDGAPLASTINYRAGKTRANNAVIALSFDGRGSITVRADQVVGSVDVILDVTGYFQ
jgi:hypothetical protein